MIMTIYDYYTELMKQSFNDSVGINYTPYAIMLFLKENNYYFDKLPVEKLCRFIYRFYADNSHFSKKNSSVLISNIEHYYSVDIKEYSIEQLKTWMKNGNEVLLSDGTYVYINPAMTELESKDITMLDKIIDSLCLRNLKEVIDYSTAIEDVINNIDLQKFSFEEYCEFVNSTKFKKRAFEEMNYCACCEEIDKKKLQCLHLDLKHNLDNPQNSIILCNEHAKMYYLDYFRFNKNGRIIIKKDSQLLDRRMHLNTRLVDSKKDFLNGN